VAAGKDDGILAKVHLLHFKSPKPNESNGSEAADETEAAS
jgi:hypothetical protein